MDKTMRTPLCVSLLSMLAALTAMLFAVLVGADASGEMASNVDRNEDSSEVEVILRLKRLGAEVSSFNESPKLLSVVIKSPGFSDYRSYTRPWTGTDEDLVQIGRLRNVAGISLSCKLKDQNTLRFLTQLPRLKIMSDMRASIDDEGMTFVGKCSALEEFTAFSHVTDVGFKRLTAATNLRRLTMFSARKSRTRGWRGLRG